MSDNDLRMTFTEHLGELRTRIIRCAIALLLGIIICFALYEPIFAMLSRPLQPLQTQQILQTETPETTPESGTETPPAEQESLWLILNPIEPFLVNLKLAAYGGIVVSLPFIIYQICAFVFPGLKPKERKAVLILLIGSFFLVVLGFVVAYFGVFPLVLPYLMQYAPEGVKFQLRLNETVSLILKGLLGFAIAFQFPMVVVVLVYLELVTPDQLRQWRKVAIVLITFCSAVFTPPDPFSMLLMAGPLVLLYEASIIVSRIVVWRKAHGKETA